MWNDIQYVLSRMFLHGYICCKTCITEPFLMPQFKCINKTMTIGSLTLYDFCKNKSFRMFYLNYFLLLFSLKKCLKIQRKYMYVG